MASQVADHPTQADPFAVELPNLALLYKVTVDEGAVLTPDEKEEWESYVERLEEAAARRDRLGLVDLGEVMVDGVTEPEMLIPNLIIKSDHHLVFGTKESAKTWLILNAAVRLIGEGKTVIWVDKEMGRRNIGNRLITLGATPEEVSERFVYLEFPSMDASKESRLLWTTLLRLREPVMVVVDAQTEVLADAGLNENSGTDIERWSQAYLTPARRQGAATLMIDHTGHGDGDRAVSSRQKGAAAKVELLVTKDEKFDRESVGRITVTLKKNTVSASIPERQCFKIGGKDGEFILECCNDSTDPKAIRRVEREMKIEGMIVEVLREKGEPLSQTQLTTLVDANKRDVMTIAQRMGHSDDSAVQMVPMGRSILYSISD